MGPLQRACGLAGTLFLLALLSACATPRQTLHLEEHPPRDIPARVELTEVPFFAQQRYQCGPAALATVLNYRDVSVTPEALKPLVYIPERKGSLQAEMLAAARRYDFLAMELSQELDALLRELAGGNPVLVLQNLGLSWIPRWHYAVVVGYDLDAGELVLRSGTHERWITSMAVFERTWKRGDYWAVVVVPAGEMPVTAQPLAYLHAASALETTGHVDAAHKAYQTAVSTWPDNRIALMGLGNTAYALKDYGASAQAFRQAVAQHPGAAEVWNNLGYALAARGCSTEALKAVRCAVWLLPEEPSFRESLSDIEGMTDAGENRRCMPVECPARTGK